MFPKLHASAALRVGSNGRPDRVETAGMTRAVGTTQMEHHLAISALREGVAHW